MCVMCYIGIDSETREYLFDKDNPAFCVERINDISVFDKDTFTTKNVYYVGSRESCGCGFGTIKIPDEISSGVLKTVKKNGVISNSDRLYFEFEDSIEEVEETIKENSNFAEDTEKLYSLLNELSYVNDVVEFFGCWAGSEENKTDKITEINLKTDNLTIDFSSIWNFNIKLIIKK